ncbi:MAG TPA: bacteriorhodopsin-like [Acidimicrobiales bacterium]|nr:bacteriorhodopsin-like [Acidimicrobiales bacterium]
MEAVLELSEGQYDLVYNAFSFVIASMGAAFVFFLLARGRVAPQHRMAVTISTLVVGIALYHYLRIFGSWVDAFSFTGTGYVQDGVPFNEGYRYVDWLLTVPLLLAELVVVLKLAPSTTRSLLIRLSVAATAMIVLGYPGEIADPDSASRLVWGILGTIPFVYILYVLFGELGRSLGRQSERVRSLVGWLRYIVLVTWSVYPLAFVAPMVIDDAALAEVVRQVGYSVADVLAKPLFGLLVLGIAILKSREDGYAEPGEVRAPDDARTLATT